MKITAIIIARNSEDLLPLTLRSIRKHVDEIVAIDHDSTDDTPEIFRSFGARVIRVPFEAYPLMGDVMWNISADLATNPWMLRIDSDEILAPVDLSSVADGLEAEGKAGGMVTIHLIHPDRSGPKVRLQRQDRIRFASIVHDNVYDLDPKGRTAVCAKLVCPQVDVRLYHLAYLKTGVNLSAIRNLYHFLVWKGGTLGASPYSVQMGTAKQWFYTKQARAGGIRAATAAFKRWCGEQGYDPDYLASQWGPEDLERALLARGANPGDYDLDVLHACHERYLNPWATPNRESSDAPRAAQRLL